MLMHVKAGTAIDAIYCLSGASIPARTEDFMMTKRLLLSVLIQVAAVAMGLVAGVLPAQAQNRLVVYAEKRMIAHPDFPYPVVVQLQDGAGNPVHAATRIAITLRSSNPGVVKVYGSAVLHLAPPHGDFKGDTFVGGLVVAAGRDVMGAATITASAPGFADGVAAIGEMIPTPQGNQKWMPTKSVSITLMPPVVVAGEKGPDVHLQPLDQAGRPTADPSATGAGFGKYRLESSNPAVFARGGERELSDRYYGGARSADTSAPLAAGQTTLTVHLLNRPGIVGGSAPLRVVPAAAIVKPPVVPPQPPPTPVPTPTPTPTPTPKPLADISKEIVLAPGAVWEGDIPVSRLLELQARLQYANVAGANFALDIQVNGRRLTGPLLNKAPQFTYKDGRTFSHYDAGVPGWMVFYSPDFSANNGPAGGGYQVMTNPGEAYRYRWDLSAVAGAGPTMHVRIAHAALKAVGPLVIRIAR